MSIGDNFQLEFAGGQFSFGGSGDGGDWLQRQFEGERRALVLAFAVDVQGAAHFLGRQRAAVQTVAVAVFLGRKTVCENAD